MGCERHIARGNGLGPRRGAAGGGLLFVCAVFGKIGVQELGAWCLMGGAWELQSRGTTLPPSQYRRDYEARVRVYCHFMKSPATMGQGGRRTTAMAGDGVRVCCSVCVQSMEDRLTLSSPPVRPRSVDVGS